ncbi:MAG: hypothetical protein IIZ39_10355 [Blautia sp.]|nr:hypothetical protein [Blautia sp.]
MNDKKKQRKMALTMSICMPIIMCIVVNLILRYGGGPQAEAARNAPLINTIIMTLATMVIVMIITMILPLGKIGPALARKFHVEPPSFLFMACNVLPVTLFNTLFFSTVLSMIGVWQARSHASEEALAQMPPFLVMWVPGWIKIMIPTLIISCIIAMVLASFVASIIGMSRPDDE